MSEIIESKAYRLTEPGKFKETRLQHKLHHGEVVIQPSLASVCHADMRYYTGQRRERALKEKLPMSLFHEGIGEVVQSKDPSLTVGQKVVIVPTIPGRLRHHQQGEATKRVVEDNYAENSAFLGSGYDGIGQSHLVLPAENAIPIPEKVPDRIALLAELNSVSLQALHHVRDVLQEGKVAVFGDGPVGYLTAAMLHFMFKIPKELLIVFGAVPEKLAQFDFSTTHLVQEFPFQDYKDVTTVIECTGGQFSESAINQAIDLIEPQGKMVLMGVTEERVPINTRDLLEKGLTLFGSSRSTAKDFQQLMVAFQNPSYQQALEKLLPEHNYLIKEAEDMKKMMDETAAHKGWEKTIMAFAW
ncbi:alcohol dehydrogenase catalytic domain-containing protein [Lederbergia sp. NSJ-179]|uniref:alcohol dehydrogenase catalytic domain-containing protein n=1 Tax=Lederbergia sp. NSJ-179 TaxID=2931402 RepID=UPI001FCFF6F8|nr:alcohol dehydrogenase catalytic domain-containing protein [Lederbergia sp. NSJ-179]MCJ7840073.1 alcohol dehydrogenase catalytic domain-containing protein [Lederbergia sp. NSJ-179]